MTPEKIFMWILNMSLTGSLMILAVLLMRIFLKKAPKVFSYMLWLIVLFRLLCPVSFGSEFSFLGILGVNSDGHGTVEYIPDTFDLEIQPENIHSIIGQTLADKERQGTSQGETGRGETIQEGAGQEDNIPNTVSLHEAAQSESGQAGTSLRGNALSFRAIVSAGSVIWIIGAAGLMIYGFGSYVHLNRKLHRLGSEDISAVKSRTRIYRCDDIPTAFVLGLFRPRTYLPVNLEEQEENYILLHEQVHIKRGDFLYRTIAYLALCLHWFNPLVWLAFHLSGMDMEMSCDEAVLEQTGSGIKKEYSQSLLALATGSVMVRAVPLAFGEGDTEKRIKNVLDYNKPRVIVLLAVLLISVTASVFLLNNPIGRAEGTENVTIMMDESYFSDVRVIGDEVHIYYVISLENKGSDDLTVKLMGNFGDDAEIGLVESVPLEAHFTSNDSDTITIRAHSYIEYMEVEFVGAYDGNTVVNRRNFPDRIFWNWMNIEVIEVQDTGIDAAYGSDPLENTGNVSYSSASTEIDESTTEAWGTCGADLTWHYKDNMLEISGTGEMDNYLVVSQMWDIVYDNRPWSPLQDRISSVYIENGVTSIGSYAFYDFELLDQVEMPDGIYMGEKAFYSCGGLTNIVIPKNSSMGMEVFYNCTSLTNITIEDGVTALGDAAFGKCSLTEIFIPDSVTSIGQGTFLDCANLTDINIPDGITVIGDAVFAGCSSLTDITIPDGATFIGATAFAGCSSLSDINIPAGVTEIGGGAFRGCSSLTNINIPDGVTSVWACTFWGCDVLTVTYKGREYTKENDPYDWWKNWGET